MFTRQELETKIKNHKEQLRLLQNDMKMIDEVEKRDARIKELKTSHEILEFTKTLTRKDGKVLYDWIIEEWDRNQNQENENQNQENENQNQENENQGQ